MKLLAIFILINILNVIIQTAKSLLTINGNKWVASAANAIAYSFYTIVLVYTMCELSLLSKCIIVGLCNLIGVYVVKEIEIKMRKDKLWKVELTLSNKTSIERLKSALEENQIPFNFVDINKYCIFNIFCETQNESLKVKKLADFYNAKYFVSENKGL